jgi:hypothetical protein
MTLIPTVDCPAAITRACALQRGHDPSERRPFGGIGRQRLQQDVLDANIHVRRHHVEGLRPFAQLKPAKRSNRRRAAYFVWQYPAREQRVKRRSERVDVVSRADGLTGQGLG